MNEKIVKMHAPCPTCQSEVIGRSDKRFCEVKCKNKHHADVRKQFAPRFKNTTKVQKRNVVILEGILGKTANKMRIHKDALFKVGFDLHVCSRAFLKGPKLFREIGEYQFELLKNGVVEVIRLVEISEFMPGFLERWEIDFPVVDKESDAEDVKRDVKNFDFERFDE